jgi:hypothetical protein
MLENKERTTDRYSDAPFVKLLIPKTKAKPSGLPDCNFIFFVATKKTKQKKAWRGAWHVLFGAFW